LFFWSEQFHKGLVGLLATQIANKYNKPSFVGALTPKGVITGSARIPEVSNANVFEALKASESVLNKFGGHPQAAGFEVAPDNADDLYISLQNYFDEASGAGEPAATYYDMEVDYSDVREFMRWSDSLEPFGCAFESPVFLLDRLQVNQVSAMKGGHLKIQFRDIRQQIIECVWFFPENPDFFKQHEGYRFSVLCEPQWNEFMGSRRLQLLLKDIKASQV
jgi:single-stranded-DNA-specific exonuclease